MNETGKINEPLYGKSFEGDQTRFENDLYYAVRTGDTDRLKELLEGREEGFLFPHSFRKSLFRASIRAAELLTAARFACLYAGCSPEAIRHVPLIKIEQLEECHSMPQLATMLKQSLLELASLSQSVQKYSSDSYSPLVNRCISHILGRMPAKVSLTELADSLHVTPRYLSTLFNRDTGMSITCFCQEVRINEAKYLLDSSDMNYPDISNYLCYGSQSYFNQVFKKMVGMTPKQYRAEERGLHEDRRDHQ